MPATQRITPLAIGLWIIALAAALFLCSRGWDNVFAGGGAHPVTNDSFYHTVRIVEIASDPASIHEFDTQLHWPQGTWLTWPWGYDYLVGAVVGALAGEPARMARLAMFTPLLILLVNLTLAGLIMRSVLAPRMAGLCLLAYAVAPLTLSLHTLGKIDHHSAEHMLWLATIYLALLWQEQPEKVSRAAGLGVVLGIACAFHNGLFILQLPVLAMLAYHRLTGQPPLGARPTAAFCIALLGSQFLVLLPSHHFYTLTYGFYYLSWFHLHVAFLTCLAVLALSRTDHRALWALLVLASLLALPAVSQALHGLGFIGAQLPGLHNILETNSPYWGDMSFRRISTFYSGLIWLAPPMGLWALYRLIALRVQGSEAVILVCAVFGILLMSLQVRFSPFGSLFLLLLPLLVFQTHFQRPRDTVYAAILLAGAFFQSINTYAFQYPLGGSDRYHRGQALIQALDTACANQPGLLLADRNWGNFLRYRTACPIIANNFIMTEEDFEAISRTDHFLSLTPARLLEELPEVRYVLASTFEANTLSRELLDDRADARWTVLAEIHDRGGRLTGRAYRVEIKTTE